MDETIDTVCYWAKQYLLYSVAFETAESAFSLTHSLCLDIPFLRSSKLASSFSHIKTHLTIMSRRSLHSASEGPVDKKPRLEHAQGQVASKPNSEITLVSSDEVEFKVDRYQLMSIR